MITNLHAFGHMVRVDLFQIGYREYKQKNTEP
jgi:hypothetical protein